MRCSCELTNKCSLYKLSSVLQLLARRLQAIESKDSVRQEQRDRMLAIEAQDKELAKMLQERVSEKCKFKYFLDFI